jgi:hypothetical protein
MCKGKLLIDYASKLAEKFLRGIGPASSAFPKIDHSVQSSHMMG